MSLGNKMKNNKSETIFEGWLVKSPPRKKFEKIWKLKWRRRWFALKQGELPGQFFLEYYTDSDCVKLKGQIDLDQCEQVDAGLRMLDKFQHMFDIKTPNRIYYLAANSEKDMREWVKWICQVCGLQETRGAPDNNDVQYFNIGPDAINEAPLQSSTSLTSTTSSETNATSVYNNNVSQQLDPMPSPSISLYQNTFGDNSFRASGVINEYCNRETILISEAHKLNSINNNNSINPFDRSIAETYTNFSTIERASIERSHSLKSKSPTTPIKSPGIVSHSRTQSLDEQGALLKQQHRKLPENLRLNNSNSLTCDQKKSPALNSSSGPYIPISECFSGGAYRVMDNKAQNSFNSHASNQYSPKSHGQNASDSESVFTDDEWTQPVMPHNTLNRDKRQSETSLDNSCKDNLGWAYVQRFSKAPPIPDVVPPPRPPKRFSGVFSSNSTETGINKESPLPSPSAFIGPKDRQSCVLEESYDIPRSHNITHQQNKNNTTKFDNINGLPTPGFSPLDARNVIASSTPNLIQEPSQDVDGCKTLPHSKQNCYTNAAPTTVEGNIFRYDFSEQGEAPVVNRKLKPGSKPKTISESSVSTPRINYLTKVQEFYTLGTPPKKNGPTVDRKLKPTTPKTGFDSIRRNHGPSSSMNVTLPDEHTLNNMHDDSLLSNKSGLYPEDRLQYLDLDHSNTPATPKTVTPVKQGMPKGATSIGNLYGATRPGDLLPSSVAYTTVDFIKTNAFNRIREESCKQRMKN
uniref:CSON010146 protein n=1 Tax=Culicoides sonorensis TaxID=179676 RepID=A0A336LKP1_CULSO